MTRRILKNQIIEWLTTCEHWFQYAGNHLLKGGVVEEALVNATYQFFKEDKGLEELKDERKSIEFKEISKALDSSNIGVILKEIRNVQNVNALVQDQRIAVDPGLTIVYGENGTGKSGYVRLLNKAFS